MRELKIVITAQDRDSQLKYRPYIDRNYDELEKATELNWHELKILQKIFHELSFRADESSEKLKKRVAQRIEDIFNDSGQIPSSSSIPQFEDHLIPQKVQRPYFNCSLDKLERILKLNWNELETLEKIFHELKFRSCKKAKELAESVDQRIQELESNFIDFVEVENGEFFPISDSSDSIEVIPNDFIEESIQDKEESIQNCSEDDPNKISEFPLIPYRRGLLRHCGYKVGKEGLPQLKRINILDSIFLYTLPPMEDAEYLQEWGNPATEKRLKKLSDCLASFARNAKRKNKDGRLDQAIQDWVADLNYIQATYYNKKNFRFKWPRT
ncbi:MAG: hypothetical protein F6K04_26460 [Leptolyngbya sp. SIO4C5]|nr:hypothetical protein [Leptolyngbya sp. SIO4C5]